MANEKRRVLGRGLESLVPAARIGPAQPTGASPEGASRLEPGSSGELISEISVGSIERNPYQTRQRLDETAMNELVGSIKSAGVIQPIVVRPLKEGRFQLIVGERRWLAAQRAGLEKVPAVVRQASNEQAMAITIIENLQREDLNPMEQAHAYARLSSEFGMTQEEMGKRTGKDRASVANFLRLLRLPGEVQEYVQNSDLSFGHAKALLPLETPATISKFAKRVIEEHLSVRRTELVVAAALNPEPPAARPKKTSDPNVREAERILEKALGLRAEIIDRNGKGKIILRYADLDDFDRVIERLARADK